MKCFKDLVLLMFRVTNLLEKNVKMANLIFIIIYVYIQLILLLLSLVISRVKMKNPKGCRAYPKALKQFIMF